MIGDELRAAVQKILDAHGDGWTVAEFAVCMVIERLNSDDTVSVEPWWWAPPDQGECRTDGVINAVLDRRSAVDYETD